MIQHENDAAYGALAIAILFEYPVSPEEAQELFDTGSIVIDGQTYRAKTVITSCRIHRLRGRGCTWWAISELTGIKRPREYLQGRRRVIAEVERRKRISTHQKSKRGVSL